MTMISKAGYFQQNGYAALDDEGMPKQIAELNIHGTKYGIRLDELKEALYGRHPARVERVFQNWQQYLGGIAGLARVSRSGKALNIELVEGGQIHGLPGFPGLGTFTSGYICIGWRDSRARFRMGPQWTKNSTRPADNPGACDVKQKRNNCQF